jgi:hypothetical protein
MGLFNIAWATGQAIGAGGGGVVAQLTSDGRAVPTRLGGVVRDVRRAAKRPRALAPRRMIYRGITTP